MDYPFRCWSKAAERMLRVCDAPGKVWGGVGRRFGAPDVVDSASRLGFFYGHLLKKGDPFVVARRGERERKGKLWWSVAPRAASGFFLSVVGGCVCRVKLLGFVGVVFVLFFNR